MVKGSSADDPANQKPNSSAKGFNEVYLDEEIIENARELGAMLVRV